MIRLVLGFTTAGMAKIRGDDMMKKSIALWFVVAMSFCALSLTAAGCDWGGCEEIFTCRPWWWEDLNVVGSGTGGEGGTDGAGGQGGTSGAGGTGGDACPEDPADEKDGMIPPECAVWVSTSGKDAQPGTQAEPVKTIAQAIFLAKKEKKPIYACGETYSEQVRLPAGVSLFGGFDCKDNWKYVAPASRATIKSTKPGEIPLVLLDGSEKSLIGDIRVEALDLDMVKDPMLAGGSSVAVFAEDFARAEIRRSELRAGNGAPGAGGEPGAHGGMVAHKGLNGFNGGDACGMDVGLGGPSVFLICDDGSTSQSGYGGDGNVAGATDGGDGEPAPNPNDPGYGKGGMGEDAVQKIACTLGSGGANGLDGANGKGASGHGTMTKEGLLTGNPGEHGQPGQPGQAGGGGGGAIGSAMLCGGIPKAGAGGGSGGTGGCPGLGGRGGQAGGSSIGLLTRSPDIVVASDVTVLLGNGGNGGNGGVLQQGGGAGLPGLGGKAMVNGVKGGCAGGPGGKGGKGGNGGGGHGGHSVAYAYPANIEHPQFYATITWGLPGEGGYGGNPAFPEGNGDPGLDHIEGLALDP